MQIVFTKSLVSKCISINKTRSEVIMKTTMKESEKLYRKTIINFIILFVACQIAF